MWSEFKASCEGNNGCPLDMEEIFTTTKLDFNELIGTDEYTAVVNACLDVGNDAEPSTLCRADSELLLYNGQDDQNGEAVDDFYVYNEPVCFPYQCTHKQIQLFHDNPLGCDPETMNCLVYHMESAECGTRPSGAGIGNCVLHGKTFDDNEALTAAKTALQAKAGMNCIKGKLQEDNNDICNMESKPVTISMGKNFRTFEESSHYGDFLNACSQADGLTCHMSALVTMKGQTGFINMDLTGDFNDYPMCLPKTCTTGEREVITTKKIGDEIVLDINKIVESHGRRKLMAQFDSAEDVFPLRNLQNEGFNCPLKGLEVCDFVVSDFYCVESVDPLATSAQSSSSSLTSAVSGSFVAAMAVGGILL